MQVIEDFTSVGTGKVVRNSSITVRDAKNTVAIYGEDVGIVEVERRYERNRK